MSSSSRFVVWSLMRSILLGVTAGASAGVLATVWTSRMLSDYTQHLLAVQRIPDVVTVTPTPVPGTYEEALSRVRRRAKTSVARFVPTSTDAISPNAWISRTDSVAYGMVVSNDGWIAGDRSAFDKDVDIALKFDVWIEQTRYSIADVREDIATGLIMVRVNGTNLVSADFAATNDVDAGTMMFAVTDTGITPTAVVESDAVSVPGVHTAEVFATTWKLADDSAMSMPIVNAAGDLAGFSRALSRDALPLHHILPMVRDVLKSGAMTSSGVGMYGVDLSDTMAIAPSIRQDLYAGFLVIAPNATTKAILVDGPADKAGIVLGDVILAVDGDAIAQNVTLAELLAPYDAGDTARFTVYRGGETMIISVTLSDGAAVIY
jgi:serine protease Do